MTNRQRATYEAIFSHLVTRLGGKAENSVQAIVHHFQQRQADEALLLLAQFDKRIGGDHGAFACILREQKLYSVDYRPIFRPFVYIYYRLETNTPERFTRDIVRDSCLHIEGILKCCVKLTFLERWKESSGNLPMGSLLRHKKHQMQFQQRFSQPTYADILWLNDAVYIHDKHNFNEKSATTWQDEEESRLFELDEAIAIYFICRHLGLELMACCGI